MKKNDFILVLNVTDDPNFAAACHAACLTAGPYSKDPAGRTPRHDAEARQHPPFDEAKLA